MKIHKFDVTVPETTVNVIVQARMGSTRLPGKVMMEMNGQPMIGHLIDRMEQVKGAYKIIYVIPPEDWSGPLRSYLGDRGCWVSATDPVRDDINDVANLFAGALDYWACDAFVRVCADSPLLEPGSVTQIISLLREGAPYVAANGISGQQAQGIQTALFLKYLPQFTDDEREHVLLFFERKLGMAVDTDDDFRRVEYMMTHSNIEDLLDWPPLQ